DQAVAGIVVHAPAQPVACGVQALAPPGAAADFFATLAVFLAGAFVAFLATFFFAAFFAAMGWLSSSVDLQYYCPVVKQRAGIGPVHNRRRAGRAGTDTAGTTRSGGRGP